MFSPARPTWIEISRSALTNNVTALRALLTPPCRLMAVVKANAYGHGAAEVARIVLDAGADALAVASLSEALELRHAGIDAPVLVLGYTPSWLFHNAAAHDVRLTVYDPIQLAELGEVAADLPQPLTVHVKVNTGMNRLGLQPDATLPFLQTLHGLNNVRVEGLFTHFATSDEAEKRYALAQFTRFQKVLAAIEAAGLRPPLVHAANSAAVLTMPQTHLDMVRSGIALYGLDPDEAQTPVPPNFRPALSWKAQVAQVRRLQPGDAVSYGREFIADRPMSAAVVPVGYADGFPRKPFHWGSLLIHGREAPILGRVCMDQTIVDVTAIVEAGQTVTMGDEVVIIGRQDGAAISAEEAGRRIGTINYDVTSRILARVPRMLVD
jgi:alanine racemase